MPRAWVRGNKDSTHDMLVQHWIALGGTWQDTHSIPGALDGIAGAWGRDQRVECKSHKSISHGKEKLSKREEETFNTWKGRKPVIWETLDDVERTMRTLYLEAMERIT